jgi:micrococcal nuclease
VIARLWRAGPPAAPPAGPLAAGLHRVVRVVDGDTIIVAPDRVVRLIGVDTPETVKPEHPVEPYGPEATKFTRRFLAAGSVQLTFDQERVDRFGRALAYVWVDDRMLNEALLRAGLARFEPHFRYSERMKSRFREAQQAAQRAEVGIWSKRPDGADDPIHHPPALQGFVHSLPDSLYCLLPRSAQPRSVHLHLILRSPGEAPWPSTSKVFRMATTP